MVYNFMAQKNNFIDNSFIYRVTSAACAGGVNMGVIGSLPFARSIIRAGTSLHNLQFGDIFLWDAKKKSITRINSGRNKLCMNQFLCALFANARKFRICDILLRADIDDLQIFFDMFPKL